MIEVGITLVGLYLFTIGAVICKKEAARLIPLSRHKVIHGEKAKEIGRRLIIVGVVVFFFGLIFVFSLL